MDKHIQTLAIPRPYSSSDLLTFHKCGLYQHDPAAFTFLEVNPCRVPSAFHCLPVGDLDGETSTFTRMIDGKLDKRHGSKILVALSLSRTGAEKLESRSPTKQVWADSLKPCTRAAKKQVDLFFSVSNLNVLRCFCFFWFLFPFTASVQAFFFFFFFLPRATHDWNLPMELLLSPLWFSFRAGGDLRGFILLLFTCNLLNRRQSLIMPRKSSRLVCCACFLCL